MTLDYRRQELLLNPGQLGGPITLVGAGGIGSPTALALAKMGCAAITVFDADAVAGHNIPNQLYGPDDMGRPKVTALSALLLRLAGVSLRTVSTTIPLEPCSGVLILAVDSMASRKAIWEACARWQPAVSLFVDARMGGEVGRIYAVSPTDPDHVRRYEATLYSDLEADDAPCSNQAIWYSSMAIAALVANVVRRDLVGQPVPVETVIDLATLTLMTS